MSTISNLWSGLWLAISIIFLAFTLSSATVTDVNLLVEKEMVLEKIGELKKELVSCNTGKTKYLLALIEEQYVILSLLEEPTE